MILVSLTISISIHLPKRDVGGEWQQNQ